MPSYRVELHSHCKGDPVDTYLRHGIFEHIDQARKVGLDAIAITWHRRIFVDPEARVYARDRGVLLIPGMEAEIGRRHLVVLNLQEGDLPAAATWDEVRALRSRKPDVFILAPHPFYPHPSCLRGELERNADCIDGVEWCNFHLAALPASVNPNLQAERWARRHAKPVIACSDAHSLDTIGKNASTVEADELAADAIFAGIRAGRIVFHRKSLGVLPIAIQTAKVFHHQSRHLGRWARSKLKFE